MTHPDTEEPPKAVEPVAFGRYTILGKLGAGGMADALLAMLNGNLGFQKLVVLKRMHASLAHDRHFVQMFLDEARLAARLNHSNVVQTTEVGEVDGQYFIAMEYLEGQSLDRVARKFIQDHGAVPVSMLLRVLCDSLDGLHYAHELKDFDGSPLSVVHRDVTPSNLFVTYEGLAKVLDFGIAKAATQDEATRTGMLKGKLAYMSPEQFHAEAIDCRSDVWSMGIVLWEMLTGRRLFKGPNDVATYKNITSAPVPPVSTYRADAPASIDRVIARALERKRENRYGSADLMRVDIESVLVRDLPHCTRADVAAEMRKVFGETLEGNRKVVREFVRLGAEHSGERLGISSLGTFKPGAGMTLSPSLSLNARDLGIPPRGSSPSPEPTSEPSRVRALNASQVFIEDGADSSEPTQVNVKPFSPDHPEVIASEPGMTAPIPLITPSPFALIPTAPIPLVTTSPALLRPPELAPPMPVVTAEISMEQIAPEPEFDPVPDVLVRKDRRRKFMESLVGWVILLGLLATIGGVTYSLRRTLQRGLDEMLHGAPPDPALLGSFQLTIESTPPGARVREGAEEIGITPLQLLVRRSLVAAQPRRFVLEAEGFQTTAAVQPNTLDAVTVLHVTLPSVNTPAPPEVPHIPVRPPRRNGRGH